MLPDLDLCLFHDRSKNLRVRRFSWLSRNRHGARLRRMVELPMAPALANDKPTIFVKQLQDLPHFHQYTPTTVVAATPRYGFTPDTPSQGYFADGFSRTPS